MSATTTTTYVTYVSPDGNYEVFQSSDTMPDGYKTVADYEAQFAPAPLTIQQKITLVEYIYHTVLQRLKDAYDSALLRADTTNATAIQSEYTAFLSAQQTDIDNIITPPTTKPTTVLPSSMRCIDCGNNMAQITLSDSTSAMQCSVCHRTESVLWYNDADTHTTATGVDETVYPTQGAMGFLEL